jgi:hypothetical protein
MVFLDLPVHMSPGEWYYSRMLYGSQYTLVSSYHIFKKAKIEMFFTKKMPKHCVAYGCIAAEP